MISSVLLSLRAVVRQLWVRTCLFTALAILAALLTPLSGLVPSGALENITEDDLSDLLDIITNSMLTVATFSLSIMVTAHLNADGRATPRSHRILQQDGRTQNVIATFIGAFAYALFGKIMLNAGVLGDEQIGVVYVVTVGVIVFVVVTIIRWVAHLDGLGALEPTTRNVEKRARDTIEAYNAYPYLGGVPLHDPSEVPQDAAPILAEATGFLQTVHTKRLSKIAAKEGGEIYLAKAPGAWVAAGDTLAWIHHARIDAEVAGEIRDLIEIGDVRSFDQDETFCLVVLTEIAERALSPGINDPRTSIDVISRLTRLVLLMAPEQPMDDPVAPRIHVPPVDRETLLGATFDKVARDGRTFVEVQLAIQTAYRTLSHHPDPVVREVAGRLSARALAYAEDGLLIAEDLARITSVAVAEASAETTPTGARRSAVSALGEDRRSSYFREQT